MRKVPKRDFKAVAVAKWLKRAVVADEVCEKIAADFPNEPLPKIDQKNVVEMLEGLVEGDLVLDDAATHHWFRTKLDEVREFDAKLDGRPVKELLEA